ncbi:hypothetical protein HBNXHr_2277 [Halorhabdus sp. BNX81]|nr:hypothetical protein HBNXHr_2277 [Halorhabdus sp. BNX81]
MDKEDSLFVLRCCVVLSLLKDGFENGPDLDSYPKVISNLRNNVDDYVACQSEFNALRCGVHLLERHVNIDCEKRIHSWIGSEVVADF